MHIMRSRRDFLASASLAAAAGVIGARPAPADERPPETTTIRLPHDPSICLAPLYISEDLLRGEGFTNIRFVAPPEYSPDYSISRGEVDFDLLTPVWAASHLDAGDPVTVVAGVHSGCYELFAHEPIRTVSDLKGKRVGIPDIGSPGHLYLAIMVAHVGLDPVNDIDWVTSASNPMELFAERKADAFLGFPPEPQELRARGFRRVILNTTTDKPWSQYFCCMAIGTRTFVHEYPVATKRFLRAILKAADVCANEPESAAQRVVDGGFTPRLDYALQALSEVPYTVWREFDPEDAMRFYALRLHEVGMITSSPNALIAEGTDWRFLNELKRELKG
jgi:NitT/TauT family transport system substrate-binding protein